MLSIIGIAGLGFLGTNAQITDTVIWRGSSPEEIATTIAGKANEDQKVQDTKFDKINNQWSYGKNYQITNTLEWIRNNIQPYIQWTLYIGLVGATILLIRNGFKMVTGSAIGGGDLKTTKENIKSILVGVLIMGGFLVIIKIVNAIVNLLFNQ